jgi:hypothetical protein
MRAGEWVEEVKWRLFRWDGELSVLGNSLHFSAVTQGVWVVELERSSGFGRDIRGLTMIAFVAYAIASFARMGEDASRRCGSLGVFRNGRRSPIWTLSD